VTEAAQREFEHDSPAGSPTSTVVICVYTDARWKLIAEALESLRLQTVQPTEVIVVVDHNEVLMARLRRAYPHLTVVPNVFERGLSGGRNTGVTRARSDVVVFLDDDARAHRDWLQTLLAPYRDPSVVGVGGAVVPDWGSAQPPEWFPDEFLWTVGCSYRGMPTSLAEVRNPIGANMSFRRSAFGPVGLFDPLVGRNDDHALPLGCEETEFSIRLRATLEGARIVYEPAAVAYHNVDPSRLSWRYFRQRCFAEGISKRRVSRVAKAPAPLRVERGYVTRTLTTGVAHEAAAMLRRPDRVRAQRIAGLFAGFSWTVAGYLREAWAASDVRKSRPKYLEGASSQNR